ncbi:MAG TPA: hypothetical protein VIS06_16450 [Mycobacteriales bacterium]
MPEKTCPVEGAVLSIPLGPCGERATHHVEITCDNGCDRPPMDVCEFHAQVLRDDSDTALCWTCDREGRGDVRVRLASVTSLASGEPADA